MDHPVWAAKGIVEQAARAPVRYTLFLLDHWRRIAVEVGLSVLGFAAAIGLYFALLYLLA